LHCSRRDYRRIGNPLVANDGSASCAADVQLRHGTVQPDEPWCDVVENSSLLLEARERGAWRRQRRLYGE
jgi:hypothetical protein